MLVAVVVVVVVFVSDDCGRLLADESGIDIPASSLLSCCL
jgi:hypothetical protein